jgi:hypothetical protein
MSIASTLIPHCLEIIIRYLTTNEDLHSCLLVNKFWANIVVPVFWEAPFRNIYDFIPSHKIIPTYIACLSDESKEILSKEYNGKFNQLTKIPFFDYPSFLTELQYDELCNAIERSEGSYCAEKVIIEICKMIAARSAALRRFTIFRQITNQHHLNDKNIVLLRLPGGDSLFQNLKPFECGYQWSTQKISLFEAMAEQCHKITCLAVKVWREDEANALANLVRQQNELTRFVLLKSNHFASILIKSLMSQRSNLTSVDFKDLFSYDLINAEAIGVLAQCANITTLNFRNCEGVDNPIFLPIGSAHYNKLTSFHYSCGNLKSECVKVPVMFLCILFNENGDTLENVSLSWNRPHSYANVSQVITTISQHCHKLKELETPVVTIEEIILILESCNQLKNLNIYTAENFDGGAVLHHLTTHHYPNLVYLEFKIPSHAMLFLDFDKVVNFVKVSISDKRPLKKLTIDSPLCLSSSIISKEDFQILQQIYPNNFKFFHTEWNHYISIHFLFDFHS